MTDQNTEIKDSKPASGASSAPKVKLVKVRLLIDSDHGKCGSTVELAPDVAKSAVKVGIADDHPSAVKAGE